MEKIEIDREVFVHLQNHARAFVDSPNSTLRRLLGIDNSEADSKTKSASISNTVPIKLQVENHSASGSRSRVPKADVRMLIEKNFLRDGQVLYLVDYQANRVKNFSAAISGNDLTFNGQRYSMSNLAQELLAQVGFKSNAVRGPAHWVTVEGTSIKDLWQQYLDKTKRK